MFKNLLFILIPIFFISVGSPRMVEDPSLRPAGAGNLVEHSYYQLDYSEMHKQARWVYYTLTPAYLDGPATRDDNFRPDPKVSYGSASLADYKGSGYDRGHLCPAAAMKLNQKAMDETFYLSNMSPQVPSFNRGKWKKLEEQVRAWVRSEDKLHVVTGPIFKNNKEAIGPNKVSVPGYYYKAIYDPTGKQKMIGFIMPNMKINQGIEHFVVTIDEIEKETGIDFFAALPDDLEEKLESQISKWSFTSSSSSYSTSMSTKTRTSGSRDKAATGTVKQSTSGAVQCKGIAKSTGQRCRNQTTNANQYCHHHQNQVVVKQSKKPKTSPATTGRCAATTQKGTRCKRQASAGSRYCWQHQ